MNLPTIYSQFPGNKIGRVLEAILHNAVLDSQSLCTLRKTLEKLNKTGDAQHIRLSADFRAIVRLPYACYAEDHIEKGLHAIWEAPPY